MPHDFYGGKKTVNFGPTLLRAVPTANSRRRRSRETLTLLRPECYDSIRHALIGGAHRTAVAMASAATAIVTTSAKTESAMRAIFMVESPGPDRAARSSPGEDRAVTPTRQGAGPLVPTMARLNGP